MKVSAHVNFDRIEDARSALGWTQEQAAKACGLSIRTWSKFKDQHYAARLDTIQALSAALRIPIEEIAPELKDAPGEAPALYTPEQTSNAILVQAINRLTIEISAARVKMERQEAEIQKLRELLREKGK